MTATSEAGAVRAGAYPAAEPSEPGPAWAAVLVDVDLLHLDRPFDYAVPEALRGGIRFGSRVRVRFGGRRMIGHVVDFPQVPAVDNPEPIRALVGDEPWFEPVDLRLYEWVGLTCATAVSEVLRHALPERVARVEGRAPGVSIDPGSLPAPAGSHLSAWRAYPSAPSLLDAVARPSGQGFYWRPLPGEDVAERVGDLVEAALGGRVAVLVVAPEAEAAGKLAAKLEARFPGLVADLSRESTAKRYAAWRGARCGRLRVAVGGRGSVLAPIADLGLIIVAEESSFTYREKRAPRFHAREVAMKRAALTGATCVLEGRLPSLESAEMIARGRLVRVDPDRGEERRAWPAIEIVDPAHSAGTRGRLHTRALGVIRDAVRRGEGVFVLAAHRGYGRLLVCEKCGEQARCGRCGLALEMSGPSAAPACPESHEHPWLRCPACSGRRLRLAAVGAGRLAEEIAKALVGVRVEVADAGTLEELGGVGAVFAALPAVVVGTEAAVKEAPAGVRTVVIADADAALRQPGFRALEEALHLWWSLAVWAGPRTGPGRVVVQSAWPGHDALQALIRGNPAGFLEAERGRRGELGYPPVGHLARLAGPRPEQGQAVRARLEPILARSETLLGPAPSGEGWAIVIKTPDTEDLARRLRCLLEEWVKQGRRGPAVSLEFDPRDLLG